MTSNRFLASLFIVSGLCCLLLGVISANKACADDPEEPSGDYIYEYQICMSNCESNYSPYGSKEECQQEVCAIMFAVFCDKCADCPGGGLDKNCPNAGNFCAAGLVMEPYCINGMCICVSSYVETLEGKLYDCECGRP